MLNLINFQYQEWVRATLHKSQNAGTSDCTRDPSQPQDYSAIYNQKLRGGKVTPQCFFHRRYCSCAPVQPKLKMFSLTHYMMPQKNSSLQRWHNKRTAMPPMDSECDNQNTIKPCTRFLSRVSVLTRDSDIVILSVQLSVRPSVRDTLVLYENGSTYRHNCFTVWQANHSRFTSIKHLHEIPTGSPPEGALNTGGV